MSEANSSNVIYIKYTSDNGQLPATYPFQEPLKNSDANL
jgi:hypothetical protein